MLLPRKDGVCVLGGGGVGENKLLAAYQLSKARQGKAKRTDAVLASLSYVLGSIEGFAVCGLLCFPGRRGCRNTSYYLFIYLFVLN